MLPQIPIIRLADSLDLPLPRYADGVGTSIILQAAVSEPVKIIGGQYITVPTGFACALPMGMEAQIRSLKESKTSGLVVLNAPFTIDASDREEMTVTLFNAGHNAAIIRRGQPIALLVFQAALRIQWDEITTQEALNKERERLIALEEAYQTNKTETVSETIQTTETLSSDEPEENDDRRILSEEEVKKIQDDADRELDKLTEINTKNIPDAYSAQALLEDPHTELVSEEPFVPIDDNETLSERTSTPFTQAAEMDGVQPSIPPLESYSETAEPPAVPAQEEVPTDILNAAADAIQTQLETTLQIKPEPVFAAPSEAPAFIADMPEVTAPVIPPMIPETDEGTEQPLGPPQVPLDVEHVTLAPEPIEKTQETTDFSLPTVPKEGE